MSTLKKYLIGNKDNCLALGSVFIFYIRLRSLDYILSFHNRTTLLMLN